MTVLIHQPGCLLLPFLHTAHTLKAPRARSRPSMSETASNPMAGTGALSAWLCLLFLSRHTTIRLPPDMAIALHDTITMKVFLRQGILNDCLRFAESKYELRLITQAGRRVTPGRAITRLVIPRSLRRQSTGYRIRPHESERFTSARMAVLWMLTSFAYAALMNGRYKCREQQTG